MTSAAGIVIPGVCPCCRRAAAQLTAMLPIRQVSTWCLQLLTKAGILNLPEWYDAGKVWANNNPQIPYCMPLPPLPAVHRSLRPAWLSWAQRCLPADAPWLAVQPPCWWCNSPSAALLRASGGWTLSTLAARATAPSSASQRASRARAMATQVMDEAFLTPCCCLKSAILGYLD